MKQFIKFAAALLLALPTSFITPRAVAQIVIGPGGSAVQTFNSLPTVADGWSGLSVGTVAGTFTTTAALDAHVITNATTNLITGALTASGTVPPLTASLPRWNSTGLYVQTKASANDYLLLLARLRNSTGSNVTHVIVSYDWDQKAANPVSESIPGHRVFYSLTGLPGSWTLIPEFSAFTTNSTAQALSASLPLGIWTNGALLHLLWADDNGPGGTTDPQEGGYTLDNFSVQAIPATVPFLLAPLVGQGVAPGETVSLTVNAAGAPPLTYQWRKNGADILGATNLGLVLTNAQAGDSGNYSVLITNQFGSVTASNVVTVACAAPVTFTVPPQSQTLTAGTGLTLGVGVTGTQPFRYQWRRNGVPLAGATNATFTLGSAQNADSGLYSVLVTNCAGNVASSNAVISIANAPFVLVGLTNHFWKYDQLGDDLDTAWRAPLYDDQAWLSGRGVFALENLALLTPLTNTVLSLPNDGGGQIITYYFRTHFSFTGELAGAQLVSSNYFDDGVVVFLNGSEALRYNMPGGDVSYFTLASAALPEGVFVISNLPPSLLVAGDNVLAVEVHQVNQTSSDVAFGMQLTLVPAPPTPLQFISQPASATVVEGYGVTFSGTVTGGVVYFQWFKNGLLIPGATAATLALSNVAPGAAGAYTLQASNHFGVILSSAATLTVVPDQSAPVLLSADLLTPTQVQLVFSEPLLLLTATNKLNYKITNTFGGQSVVQNAVLTNQTNVLLTVSALAGGVNYIATALNIADSGPNQNALPASIAPVARLLTLVAFGATWDYYDPFPEFGDTPPGPGWREPGYDTSFWGQGAGAFRDSIDESLVAPVTVGTALSQTPTPTAFFRQPFTSLALSPGGLRLTLRSHVNDAAAFYLNGVELFRTNLPEGTITSATPALVSLGSGLVSSTREVSAPLLRAGSNLLAVELHQFTDLDSQKFFAAELVARAESLLVGPLRVLGGPSDATVLENRPVTFRVSSVAASGFQWQVNGGNVFGATNDTFTFPASIFFDGAQIRCRVSQAGTTNFTTNATVHVLPDNVRPALLAAHAADDGSITLTFSEALDAISATNATNYVVTNGLGQVITLTNLTLVNGSNVVLRAALLPPGRYGITVRQVRDTSVAQNTVPPGSTVLSGYHGAIVTKDTPWRYDATGVNRGASSGWAGDNYDDSNWTGTGQALFVADTGGFSPYPEPVRTSPPFTGTSSGTALPNWYFRTLFVLNSGGGGTLVLHPLVDDGAVFYLNGVEIFRLGVAFNVTPGFGTLANRTVGDAIYEGPFTVPVTNLVAGTNVLAVLACQVNLTSQDFAFGLEAGLELTGQLLPADDSAPVLRFNESAGQLVFSWDGSGVLESAPTPIGPWTTFATDSPQIVSPTNNAAFFRVRQ